MRNSMSMTSRRRNYNRSNNSASKLILYHSAALSEAV
jgi:hypothetical protein